jgi:hypothetical protein
MFDRNGVESLIVGTVNLTNPARGDGIGDVVLVTRRTEQMTCPRLALSRAAGKRHHITGTGLVTAGNNRVDELRR